MELRRDAISRRLYSCDASIYEVEPWGIAFPRSRQELVEAVQLAASEGIPLIPRGAGTGTAGSCLGPGLVVDSSRFLTRILDINPSAGTAVVEGGVVQDALNDACAPFGLRLGPDTSTGNRATIAGMIATNAAGAHALHYGRLADHILDIELVRSDGTILHTAEGLPALKEIQRTFGADIRAHFPKLPRRSSGYNLDALPDATRLVVGSEGTLGLIATATLRLVPQLEETALVLFGADELVPLLGRAEELLQTEPYALEFIDHHIIAAARNSPTLRGRLDWLQGTPAAIAICELPASRAAAVAERFGGRLLVDRQAIANVWATRKLGLGLLLSQRSYLRAIAFIEDMAVPVSALPSFVTKLQVCLQAHGRDAGIYGHMGDGCLHVRPYIDLRQPSERATMQRLMLEVTELVRAHGGVMSGEHGDGLVRSWLNPQLFGPRLMEAFVAVKRAFDPTGLMNPGKILPTQGLLENLRATPTLPFPTTLDFGPGGIQLAVDLCNGNGECRKQHGLMCPSYQATHDERDSTRARAQAFRALLDGSLPPEALYGSDFHDVMDLCIQCKGCKTECPSQVDMASIKAEYLHACHRHHGSPLRDYLFGYMGRLLQLMSYVPRIANAITQSRPMRALLRWRGIAAAPPPLARKRFSSIEYEPLPGTPIVLFVDTWTEHVAPQIGLAALQLLEQLGYAVHIPPWRCCGRTLISKGFLPQARGYAQALVDQLYPYAAKGMPICGLEPSCILTLQDEYRAFGLDRERAACVAAQATPFDVIVWNHRHALRPTVTTPVEVLIHTHCHQKALVPTRYALDILQQLPGVTVHEVPSGCCGMAGSFGYESEHCEMAARIGELALFPALRAHPNALVVANGTSCRQHIRNQLGIEPLHLAEFLLQRTTQNTENGA